MAGYTIGSEKGKQIASGLKSGQTYKASDGSTWKKNSDGSVSVTTKQGSYTANALSGSSGSSSSSKSSSSSSGLGTYIDPDSGVEKSLSELPEWLGGTSNGSPAWLANAPSMGGTRDTSSNSYYDSYLRDQQKAIKARIKSAVASNNAYIPQVNTQSDEALQNAYIAREQSRVNAPQAMAAMGYTGGAAESTLLGINTNYENSRNTIETNRQNALNDIYQNEQKIRSEGDATLADAASTYYQNLIAAQQRAAEAAQDQANWQAEFDLEERKYADAAAQQEWLNAYNEKLLAIKASNSGKTSSSSGSSSSTNKNVSGNYNTVLTNVKRALGGSNAGSRTAMNAAINYIQNSLRNGTITEYEAQQMLSQLNLD